MKSFPQIGHLLSSFTGTQSRKPWGSPGNKHMPYVHDYHMTLS